MDPLEGFPIAVLLALQAAMGDPFDKGRPEGFVLLPPRFDPEPIPMEEAEEGVESVCLRFDR